MKYPLEKKRHWHTDQDYKKTGGEMVDMSPEKFLKKVRRLNMDDHDEAVLKRQLDDMNKGEHLEPMQIRADGTEDGRHRALAAMVKGIDSIPVLKWPDRKDPGKTNKGVMGTIKKVVKKFRNNEKYK